MLQCCHPFKFLPILSITSNIDIQFVLCVKHIMFYSCRCNSVINQTCVTTDPAVNLNQKSSPTPRKRRRKINKNIKNKFIK